MRENKNNSYYRYGHPRLAARIGLFVYNSIVIGGLIIGSLWSVHWLYQNKINLAQTASQTVHSIINHQPVSSSDQTYPIPTEIQPILTRVGIDRTIVGHINISIPADASDCLGVNSDAASGEAASCFISPNRIVFPQTLLSQHSKLEQNYIFSHEYLHYIWAGMSQSDKNALAPFIEQVYAQNQRYLDSRLSGYAFADEDTRLSELHSYIGTELADYVIPTPLLDHYKQYLPNRNALPSFSPRRASNVPSSPPVYRLRLN